MIKKFKHKGLQGLFNTGKSGKVAKRWRQNCLLILDHIAGATEPRDCNNVKDFHELGGKRKGTYSMHVTGNWCITFKFEGEDVTDIDLEDYH